MASEVTLKQIADKLGVSTMTVSRALNGRPNVDEGTKKRVLEKARDMGYTPNNIAKSLVSEKTNTIGVVVPEIAHSFFAKVIQGIEEVTYEKDYRLILTHSNEQADRQQYVIETLLAQRVDGIMVSMVEGVKDYSLYKRIIDSKTKLVFFDRCKEGIGASCVSVDDRAGSYKITEHLIQHGYKKLAHLRGSLNISVGKERMRGFKEAVMDNGLIVDNNLISESGFDEEGGYRAMKRLLEQKEQNLPDAVFAVNDPAAFGAMDAIYDHGLSVPDDIALVGFSDDIRAPLMRSPLTTVHQPARELGNRAAKKLMNLIDSDNESAENIELLTSIKIRKSCGCGL